ncbi:MAG TPA: phosphotransferase [Myxococcota bacterium]|nr:phosphotransferase [Myxococcota bacterium]
MGEADLEAVPEAQRALARAALAGAFGRAPDGPLVPVLGGASGALAYRVEVGGRAYLLRLEPPRNALRNPHHYACLRAAAEAGVAPRVHWVDAEQGAAVMDFVAQRPLQGHPGGAAGLAGAMGALLRRLQGSPPFPAFGGGHLELIARMLDAVHRSALFAPGLLEPHREGFARIRAAYAWHESALVSSHNDPNPRNVLFDGERLWLVDWETAYRNDPLTDVAIATLELAGTPELRDALVRAWLGRAADRALLARLELMRALARLYYAGTILARFAAAPLRAAPDADLKALSPAELGAAVASGRLAVGSPEMMYALGKLVLAQFLDDLRAPGFEESLAIARAG